MRSNNELEQDSNLLNQCIALPIELLFVRTAGLEPATHTLSIKSTHHDLYMRAARGAYNGAIQKHPTRIMNFDLLHLY